MDQHKKNNILINCNNLDIHQLIAIVKSGEITIDEFAQSGLSNSLVAQIVDSFKTIETEKNTSNEKEDFLKKIKKNKISADDILSQINSKKISFDDLEDEGVSAKVIAALKYYNSANRVTIFKNIDQLPVMEEGRTDLYFVGVPGSGKSTMLAGLLNAANKKGILLPDTYNNDGSRYQTQLIQDLSRGVLPPATASGSYNYVALSLKDDNDKNHPFNIVEVPGENYINMFNNGDVQQFLNYINNKNKKILVFVIDSLAHDSGYVDSKNSDDQSLVYVNILNMFAKNGVLEETDAIYLVSNKFDAIKNSRYATDNRNDDEMALDFLQEEFKSLINNCKDLRNQSKNKFKIKVLPYSIGNVVYESIIDDFNMDYSLKIINEVLADSFVIKGGKWTKMFKL